MKTRLLTVPFVWLSLSFASAELPPDVYKADQARSPEALVIKVSRVEIETKSDSRATRSKILAQAKVLEVNRSASNLRPGDVIRVAYTHLQHRQPMVGPSQPDIVQQNRTYPAFLVKDEKTGTYGLAARGYSFRLARW